MSFRRRRCNSGTRWFRLILELYPNVVFHTLATFRCQDAIPWWYRN